jgi:hypothetical protein
MREGELAAWEIFNFRGHWLAREVEIAEAVRRAMGIPAPVKHFSWFPIQLTVPVYPLTREMGRPPDPL